MNLTYKINKIETIPVEFNNDTGLIKTVQYTLYNNNEKIGDFIYNDEKIPFKKLQSEFIHTLILEGHLPKLMEELNKTIPDEEFFTEICEDDFYTETKHDIRNPELINYYEVRERGKDVHMCYFFFLREHWDDLKDVI